MQPRPLVTPPARRIAARGVFGFVALLLLGATATGDLSAAQMILTWDDNSWNETGFRIERALAGLLWEEVATVPANTTRYADTLALPGLLYTYRVSAFNPAGRSPWSNLATGILTLPTHQPPLLDALLDRVILAGATVAEINLALSDPDTPAAQLSVSVTSSNPVLVPASGIRVEGSGATRRLVITPDPEQSGSTRITVRVSDGTESVSQSFLLRVELAATPPVFERLPRPVATTAGAAFALEATARGTGPVTYQWYRDGVPIPGATAATYVVPSAQRFHAGSYEVRTLSGGRAAWSPPVAVTVAPVATNRSRLLNLSARAWCSIDEAVMIPGMVIAGSAPMRVLLRAVGPALGRPPFDVPEALPDPRLRLRRWNGDAYEEVVGNRDWSASGDAANVRVATETVGAFALPANLGDAALVADLAPGRYSVLAEDEEIRNGIALVEIYQVGTTGAKLVNLSNRGWVGEGAEVMIAGFVVADDGPVAVLLRAVGPTLSEAPFNVSGAMDDPVLEVYAPTPDGGSRLILANDNWSENPDSGYTAEVAADVGAFALPDGARDAALVATLPPGAYTAIVRGTGRSTGVALMEVYTLP